MGDVSQNPIRGNDGLYITIKPEAAVGAAEEFDGHILDAEFTNRDREGLTFAEVMSGDVKAHGLKVTMIADLSPGSLYRLVYDNPAGRFAAVVGFYGNAVSSASKPHYTGVLKANGKPLPKSSAKTTDDRETTEYEFNWAVGPDLDDGA